MNPLSATDISAIRKDYSLRSLEISDVSENPLKQFNTWLAEAIKAEVLEPTAMSLATVSHLGKPSCRIVLLKGVEDGFVFYTNYLSRKGGELAQVPMAALTFFWPELERQVRIEGIIEKVSPEESLEYFNSRPRESRLGAWASPQSQPIKSRAVIEEKMTVLASRYKEADTIPLPEHWGGYRLVPERIEFWQGRPSRLHDRIAYSRSLEDAAASWNIERLAP
jgi:pyridoxamine 5'-phosphate oxidase